MIEKRRREREKGNIYPNASAARALFLERERGIYEYKKERRRCINSYLVFAGAGRFDDAHFSWFRSHVFLCFLDVCECSKLRKVRRREVLWERFRAVHSCVLRVSMIFSKIFSFFLLLFD